ncbi:MAG: hypothetical protein U0795_19410 [Pirellulales bacterium]
MDHTNTVATGTAATQPGRERPQFFARSALIMAIIVVLSFPLTYFHPVATGSRKFDTLHHLHGLAYFAWIGLYLWQTLLVARGQIARHREIGLAGFALTGLMVPLGRLHPATWTSLALVVPLHISAAWIARTEWWNAVAPGLIGPP